MRYVHLACTPFLTHMHTGDRSADAVDAGGVLPGYTGILVRDGNPWMPPGIEPSLTG